MNAQNLTPALLRNCLSLEDGLELFRGPYRRIALVSDPAHLAAIGEPVPETLVVSSDWLLWQQATATSYECLYFEAGLLNWPDSDFGTDLYLRANEWVFENGKDVTLFHGVSLGRQVTRIASLAMVCYLRQERALRQFVERFQPEEIVYFDYCTELGILDAVSRREIVQTVARDNQVEFIDRSNSNTEIGKSRITPIFPDAYGAQKPQARDFRREILIRLYEIFMALASRTLRALAPRRPAVLFTIGSNNSEPMIRSFAHKRIAPLFSPRALPKRFGPIVRAFARGMLFPPVPRGRLTAADRKRVAEIEQLVRLREKDASDSLSRSVFRTIRKNVVDSGRFVELATTATAIEALLDRWRPAAVVTSSVFSPPNRIYLEIAQRMGMKTFFTHHSVMALDLKFDLLSSDDYQTRPVDACLSWGAANDEWLAAIHAKCCVMRTGSPLAMRRRMMHSSSPSKWHKALVLQYTPVITDLKGLNARQFSYFVDVVRRLHARGIKQIRVKLHPGIWSDSYYRMVAKAFELDCEIIRHGSFEALVDWADFVIGPSFTGAMQEVLAMGKPYYAVLLQPSSIGRQYFRDIELIEDLADLDHALDELPRGADRVLESFCSATTITNPAIRAWDVLTCALADGSVTNPEPSKQRQGKCNDRA